MSSANKDYANHNLYGPGPGNYNTSKGLGDGGPKVKLF
jgi:hypothetical protein